MYQVAVLDDDKLSASLVAEMVGKHHGAEELAVKQFSHFSELAQQVNQAGEHFDIAFVDIRLGDDEPNGIEAVQALFGPASGTQVIYVTGCDGMHAKVYRTKHISFLTKPIDAEDFAEALDRALANLAGSAEQPIRVHVGRTERKIYPREVCYIESKGRVIEIHLADGAPASAGPRRKGEVVRTYMQLGEVGELLGERFARVHQSYLVNLDAVVELGAHHLVLTDGSRVPVSRSRSTQVREMFFDRVRGL